MINGATMEFRRRTRFKRVRKKWAKALSARTRQFVSEFRIILQAFANPAVPCLPKLVCGLAVLYVVSPIQLIPNFIPILGQLDDVLVVGLAIRVLRKFVPPIAVKQCQNGLDEFAQLAEAGEAATL
jgi:uncharacterized membrane protein YkvA (DUF1232 family)